jgi:hypothetical protein
VAPSYSSLYLVLFVHHGSESSDDERMSLANVAAQFAAIPNSASEGIFGIPKRVVATPVGSYKSGEKGLSRYQ